MTALYELSQTRVQLLDMADSMDTEVFIDTLASIDEALEDKVENTAKLIRCLESDAEALKAEEKRLADKRKAIENKVSSIKEYLQHEMEFAGIDKIKRATVTVSIQLNPPSAEILDESIIPSSYLVPQPDKIDRKAILKALKEGEEIPGCEISQSRGLRIR
jgi:hypothetical protein